MSTVYIREQGAVVRRRGERLLVTKRKAGAAGKKQLLDLPLLHLTQVVVFGNVQLTAPAVAMLLQAEVDVVFLSLHGKFRGRLVHTGSKFARLRHNQLRRMSDDATCLAIARQVVQGKLRNQRAHLQSYAGQVSGETQKQLRQLAQGIDRLAGKAGKARTPDSLRGFEGSAGALYWRGFKALLKNDFGFKGRKYYPPPDPVNALLSFGYSLLLKDVTAAVQVVGLDPYLGFFHAIDYGRPALVLDMMEEFRPVLVDRAVVSLINQGQITEASFERATSPKLLRNVDVPIRLTGRAIEALIGAYERALSRRLLHADGGGRTSLRRIIELQVRRLARVVSEEGAERQRSVKRRRPAVYRPFMVTEGWREE